MTDPGSSFVASVVIPAYESQETIMCCLAGLESQDFQDFEAIVVDSSPQSLTCELVTERFPWVNLRSSPVRLLPHAARNEGFRVASGRLLISLDPDCEPCPEWLGRLVQTLDDGHLVVGGAIESAERDWFTRGIHICKFGWLLDGAPAGSRPFLAAANQGWTREAWETHGPLSPGEWSADTELDWRIRKAGIELRFEPRALVHHSHRTTGGSFWRERLARGSDFARLRADFGCWSRARIGIYLLGMAIEPVIMLVRTLRDAARAGRLKEGVEASPVCFIGSVAWAAGEARALAGLLVRGGARLTR